MFKTKQANGPGFGGQSDQEFVKTKPLSIQLPDVHESMRLAGVKDVKPKTKRERLLCCCGVPGCGIGPMTRIEEVA